MTVLFADLKGSLELLADRDPEEARQLLDPVIERMIEAVHRYEGTVNQVMGDGIMALFGAPLAHEDHAVRACYAALRMQESVTRYGDEMQRSHGVPVQIRVGLNSGAVVVRAIDSSLHMDYTAVGQTTHLAARMEQMAKPGSVLITAETLRLAEGLVQVRPLGPVPVKGLAQPVEVFELMGAMPTRTRLQAAAARGLTRFVGRQAELEALRQALERTGTGHGQIVAVIGEPGVGKTRLFYEFTHAPRTPGWLILESHSVSYGKATPYLPVRDLLKVYFEIDDRDEARKIREKVTGKLLTLDAALGPTLPAFLTLLDVPVDDPAWQALDPLPTSPAHPGGAETPAAAGKPGAAPAAWSLRTCTGSMPRRRHSWTAWWRACRPPACCCWSITAPSTQHGWGGKTYYTQLRLDPLPPERAEELLEVLLGDDPGLTPLKQRLDRAHRGQPVLPGGERPHPGRDRGIGGRAREPIAWRSRCRAFRCRRRCRRSWQHASTGCHRMRSASCRPRRSSARRCPWRSSRPSPNVREELLRLGLTHLQAAEFLYETRLFPEIEYTFKHALTHQVAYESLLQERRRALHARIVEALEALAGDRVAEQVERLAHHALRGEVWDKALAYCRQAGEKAMARSAHREAVGSFEQALSALSHLPETRDTREQAIDLRLALRSALLPSGNSGRILAYLREAETLAAALDDPRRLGQVSGFLSNYFYRMGAYDQAIAAAQRTLALATAGGEVVLHALANYYLGTAYQAQGDYRRAIDCLGQTVASLDGARRHERFGQFALPAVLSRTYLAWCHAELGTFAEGSALGEEGLRIAEAVAHPASLTAASWGIGLLALRQGDLPRALPLLERAMGICQEVDLPVFFPRVAAALGAAYTLSGRIADAVPLLTQAMEQTTAMEMVRLSGALSSLPGGGAAAGRPPGGGARPRRADAGARPCSTRNVATRRMPCASSARLRHGAHLQSMSRLKTTTARPSPWPRNSACGRSWPTAISVSGNCTPKSDAALRPAPNCPPPSTSTEPWT